MKLVFKYYKTSDRNVRLFNYYYIIYNFPFSILIINTQVKEEKK